MNTMLKNIPALFLVCATMINTTNTKAPAYSDTTPITVPGFIDGLSPLGINGHEVEKLLFIRHEMENIMHGVLDKESHMRVGKYMMGDNAYTLEDLARFELHGIKSINEVEMQEVLGIVKIDFMRIAKPFVEQARSVKAITLKFLDEWAYKHNKEKSALLDWTKEEDGKELEFFNNHVKSFRQLHEFCIDLVSFITDLIQSCPKAWAQYKELKKKRAAQKVS